MRALNAAGAVGARNSDIVDDDLDDVLDAWARENARQQARQDEGKDKDVQNGVLAALDYDSGGEGVELSGGALDAEEQAIDERECVLIMERARRRERAALR